MCCVFEDGPDLIGADAGKPFHELRHCCAVFEILEQRGNRYARTVKHPSVADDVCLVLDARTRRPINHDFLHLSWAASLIILRRTADTDSFSLVSTQGCTNASVAGSVPPACAMSDRPPPCRLPAAQRS